MNDQRELEADRVADRVMRVDLPARAPATGASRHRAPPAVGDEALRSEGQPLDASARSYFEPRFGQDFRDVRIHADDEAAQSARALNARAFTVGDHILFGRGQFDAIGSRGRHLIAHELAHVAQSRALSPRPLPIFRQVDSESEESRRQEALASLDWIAAIAPIVIDDNAPILVAWAQKRAIEFDAPETTSNRRHYLALGLLKVFKQLQKMQRRAKRGPAGELLYTDALTEAAVPWTAERASTLDDIAPFTPSRIVEWQTAAETKQRARRRGRPTPERPAARPSSTTLRARRTGINITFSKREGMSLKSDEGQRLIMYYVLSATRTGLSADQLDWVASRLPLQKRWEPPPNVDLAAWQESFEKIPQGGEITLTITNAFTTEVDALLSDAPSRRDFQVEAVRQGVVDAKAGLYLGIGTFAVGALAFGGSALLGATLGAAGGAGFTGLLAGQGTQFVGGAIGRALPYAYLNAPALYGDALLYGGAVMSGVALGEHLLDVRSQGVGWHDLPRLAGDLIPLASGYVESGAFRRPGGDGGGQDPPSEEGGGGGGIPPGRQTIRSSPPPMPASPRSPVPSTGTPTIRSSPPPPPLAGVRSPAPGASGPTPATDAEVIQANVKAPGSVIRQEVTSHEQDWSARNGTGPAPSAYHDGEGNVRVSADNWLFAPARPGVIFPSGPRMPSPVGPASAPTQPAPAPAASAKAPADIGLADTGQAPPAPLRPAAAPAQAKDLGLEDTGQVPGPPQVGDPLGKTPAAPVRRPGVSTGVASAESQRPMAPAPPQRARWMPLDPPQAVSADMVSRAPRVGFSASHDDHQRGWNFAGGQGNAPTAFIFDGFVYVDPSRWPPK